MVQACHGMSQSWYRPARDRYGPAMVVASHGTWLSLYRHGTGLAWHVMPVHICLQDMTGRKDPSEYCL